MLPPLANVLVKTLGKDFYRSHAGFFLFFFITFLMYFFFINVLNETHIPPEELIVYNLILVLTFVGNPFIAILIFIVWLIYTVKSWNYITGQLLITNNAYLFYSSTSFSRSKQFLNWLILQWFVSIPLISYGLFSIVVGAIFNHYIIPAFVLLYLMLLTSITSGLYVWKINRLKEFAGQSLLLKKINFLRKPFFSLFLFYMVDKLKLKYIVTKTFSLFIISGFFYLFPNEIKDMRLKCIVVLCLILAHIVLIYDFFRFEDTFLKFARNLPNSPIKIFTNYALLYLMLLLPESLYILFNFEFLEAMFLVLLEFTTALLFYSLLYCIGLNMSKFIKWLFFLSLLMCLIAMFNVFWILIPINLIFSFIIVYKRYYRIEIELL